MNQYLVISRTKDLTVVKGPAVAGELKRAVQSITDDVRSGNILRAGMIGPLTPVMSFALHEANTHSEVIERVNGLPGNQHLHHEVHLLTDAEPHLSYFIKLSGAKKPKPKTKIATGLTGKGQAYWCWSTVREHANLTDRKVASAFAETLVTLEYLQSKGMVTLFKVVGAAAPFQFLHIEQADSHESLFARITRLPAIPYMHTQIKPVIDLGEVHDYLDRHVKGTN